MFRFDKSTYLSLLVLSILSARLTKVFEDQIFTIFRIHKYIMHFFITSLLHSLHCYILF